MPAFYGGGKMKIKFKNGIAGPNYNYDPGDTANFEEKQAIRLCEAGIAQPVKEKVIETAEKKNKEEFETSAKDYPVHAGGGWYKLSDGSSVQGKDEAIKAEKKLGD